MEWARRPFSRATPLCHGLDIVHPDAPAARDAAERLARATGGKAVPHGAFPALETAEKPTLLLGNLDENRHMAQLYRRHMAFCDYSYPGAGGFVLRTLVDPFATGHNVLLLGYSNAAGLAAGCAALLAQTAPGKAPCQIEYL